jgi:hypothetical protein
LDNLKGSQRANLVRSRAANAEEDPLPKIPTTGTAGCCARVASGHAAKQRDELAALHHSITSSARASSVGGTVRPSALAVVRSNFVEARRMRACYPSRPSARMVSCTFGLAPILVMYALMFGHFARSILWILVQLSTVNR